MKPTIGRATQSLPDQGSLLLGAAPHQAWRRLVDRARLTEKRATIVQYLLLGYERKEIASALLLAPETVREHVKAIHRSFGVSSTKVLFRQFILELEERPDEQERRG